MTNNGSGYATDTSQYVNPAILPVGTKFFVVNGCWWGEIVIKNGKKHVRVTSDLPDDYVECDPTQPPMLEIEI